MLKPVTAYVGGVDPVRDALHPVLRQADTVSAYPTICPYRTISAFASDVGVSADTVRGWVDKGYLPVRRIGRRVLVDVAGMLADTVSAP